MVIKVFLHFLRHSHTQFSPLSAPVVTCLAMRGLAKVGFDVAALHCEEPQPAERNSQWLAMMGYGSGYPLVMTNIAMENAHS